MKRIVVLIFLSFTFCTYSQDKQNYFRSKVNMIEKSMDHYLSKSDYIFYGTEYKMLMFVMQDDNFLELTYEDKGDGFQLENILCLNLDTIKLFDKEHYVKGYIDFDSKFYTNLESYDSSGLPVYFSYNIRLKSKYCEYILNVFTNPIPINNDVHNYLSLRLLGLK